MILPSVWSPNIHRGASSAHDGSIERGDGSKQGALFIKRARSGEGRGKEWRREAVNPTHGVLMSRCAGIRQPESIPTGIEFCVAADQEKLF